MSSQILNLQVMGPHTKAIEADFSENDLIESLYMNLDI